MQADPSSKPSEPASGRRGYPVRHPVFPIAPSAEEIQALKARTRLVRSFAPSEIEAWIVLKSSFEMVACPNCEWPGGRRDRKNYWAWSEEDPDHVRCTHCGAVSPGDAYPLDRVERAADPTGQMQEFPYWEAADGYRFYLQGKVENCKKQHLERMTEALAQLYAGTEDPECARQAARILSRLADAYPHYNAQICRKEGSPVLLYIPSLHPPDGVQPVPGLAKDMQGLSTPTHYPYWSNRRGDGWNGWHYSEMPVGMVRAYDWIAACPALDDLSRELGLNVRRHIEDFFRATANFNRSYPIYLSNMDPSLIRGLATIGRVIGEPVFVHDALRRARMLLDWQLFPDGNWRECAPSYHQQAAYGLQRCVRETLEGYSDPEGYVDAEDGTHVVDLDPIGELPLLQECIHALERVKTPEGDMTCVHDTWSAASRGKAPGTVTEHPAETHLHWGMGHAMMGLGRGNRAVQAHLHFSGGYGHTHADTLNLILFGCGRELISDIGYTHTVLRPFACGSLAHNLVLVDRKDQRMSGDDPPADGYLLAWAQIGDRLRFCEAGGEGAYPDLTRVYRRAVWLVDTPGGGAYAVDVFRVRGGSRHDWVLHGDADADQLLDVTLGMQTFNGSLLPAGAVFHRWDGAEGEYGKNTIDGHNNSYGLFENLRTGSGEGTWSAVFRYADAEGPALRTTVLGQAGARVFAGDLPSIRRAQENSGPVYDYRMPAVVVCREGADLYSTFAAVHQPCLESEITVERLALEDAPEGAVGIVCRGRGFTDYHLCGADADSDLLSANLPLHARGRYAFVRIGEDGQAIAMALVDGTEARFGSAGLTRPAGESGYVLDVRRREVGDAEDALVVDARLGARKGTPGERAIVKFANGTSYGLAVSEIRREGDRSVIVLGHRPGFELNEEGKGAVQTHHPHLRSAGRPRVYLPAIGFWKNDAV